jgi:hypothetical protein
LLRIQFVQGRVAPEFSVQTMPQPAFFRKYHGPTGTRFEASQNASGALLLICYKCVVRILLCARYRIPAQRLYTQFADGPNFFAVLAHQVPKVYLEIPTTNC